MGHSASGSGVFFDFHFIPPYNHRFVCFSCISSFWSISVHHICFSFTLCSIQSTSTFTTIASCNSCTHSHAISHCCHVMPLFVSSIFFLSSAVGHCTVDLGQSGVSTSHSHPLQFLPALNAPTPLPCLHFLRFPHGTLRSCPGTPTCSHLTYVFDREDNEQRCPSHT